MSFDPITYALCKGGSDGKKYEWKPIIESTELSFDVSDGHPYFEDLIPTSETQPWEAISDGDVCKTVIDGSEYICSADMVGTSNIFIGKHHEVNSDLPFMIWFQKDVNEWYVTIELLGVHGDGTTHNIALYLQVEATQSGSSGGGGLTVIELETALADENTTMLSEADIAKLSAAMEAKMPVVISFELDIAGAKPRFVLMFDYFTVDGIESFYAKVQVREFMFTNSMGMWMAVVQTMT